MRSLRARRPALLPRLQASALALGACLAACAAPSARGPRGVPQHDAATFYATVALYGADFSPDGSKLLLTSDQSGTFNAWEQPLDGSPMRRLTDSTTDAISALTWFPADERFLYSADQGGNERNHVYVRERDGAVHDLTPGAEVKARFVRWAADERSFFLASNARDARFFDLQRVWIDGERPPGAQELAPGYASELVFANPGGYELSDVSRDGRWVALTKTRSNADSDVFVARVEAPEELVAVTPHEGDQQNGVAEFSPEGDALLYTTDAGGEWVGLRAFDLETRTSQVVFQAPWDVSFAAFSRDGRYLVTGVNADASTEVHVHDRSAGEELALPELPAGEVRGLSFEPGGSRMAFYVDGDRSPANLYLAEPGARHARRLSDALDARIDEDDLVEAEVIRYPSFDGLAIPALLYRPHQASADAPAPALVWVHGGPGGQSRRGYNPTIQHLVNHGYAVLAVNNRGSSGYGRRFHHLDDRRHGQDDLQDCIFGRRWLAEQDWVDGERVGIIGGSYGGYMVCAALAFEPEAFEVGIDIFGVTNWVRTLERIPAWWANVREALYAELGDPVRDRERLEARSPLLHAHQIRKPLLVVQGANDPRVLQAESDELVAAVRARGVPVEYVLFPDEGHGFRGKENRITASEAYLRFLEEHLAGPRP